MPPAKSYQRKKRHPTRCLFCLTTTKRYIFKISTTKRYISKNRGLSVRINPLIEPFIRLRTGFENNDLFLIIFFDQVIQHGTIFGSVFFYERYKFRIQCVFCPRNIRSFFTYSFDDTVHTLLFAEIQEKHCITGLESYIICSAVITVYDPFFALKDPIQRFIKFIAGDMCSVGFPPDIIKMSQRQAGQFVKFSRKRAFPASGTPQNDNFLCIEFVFHPIYFPLQIPICLFVVFHLHGLIMPNITVCF